MCSIPNLNECEKLREDFDSLQTNFDDLLSRYNELEKKYSKLTLELESKTTQVDKLFSNTSEKREITLTLQEMAELKQELAEFIEKNKSTSSKNKSNITNKKSSYTQIGNLRVNLSKIEVITQDIPLSEYVDLKESEYEVLTRTESHRLCANSSQYYLKKRFKYKLKLKNETNKIITIDPWKDEGTVIEKSFIDASFLADLVVEKYLYHLPLYRQHQRVFNAGIKLDRGYLSKLMHRVADLIKPIHNAQMNSILESEVLIVDETKLRVGVDKSKKKMKEAYLVPLLGDKGEICFVYSEDRKLEVLDSLLSRFVENNKLASSKKEAVLLTDGYKYYETFACNNDLLHAFCWSHTRRKFLDAEKVDPEVANFVIELIAQLYVIEKNIKELDNDKKLKARNDKSKPIVNRIFEYLQTIKETKTLLPSSYLLKAINYAQHREKGLREYLKNPNVNIDTNSIERENRPVAVGRKNYLFCMKEEGAEVVAICYSIIRSCLFQEINPFEYLSDVLVRVGSHPASKVEQLTPRLWKKIFANKKNQTLLHTTE